MLKILIVFGTRPEAIKMAPLIKEIAKHPDKLQFKVCVTAQHREMLDQVLDIFEITPDYDLNIMKKSQDLFDITSLVLIKIKEVLEDYQPDIILVHGDTTTTMATSLAAFYKKIEVGHVEAGLRTNNLYSPWPEEMNRQITDRICTYYFAPTTKNIENLRKENLDQGKMIVTGNTVIDALNLIINQIKANPKTTEYLKKKIANNGYKNIKPLESNPKQKLLLVTGHRRENFGQGFLDICEALKTIAERQPDLDIVYPVHLNPNVQKPVYKILKNIKNIYLIEPLDYLPFVYLMNASDVILTDSGGIQEEAPGLGKPVLVMRNTTERPEGVEAGTVKLVGTDKRTIIQMVEHLIKDKGAYDRMAKAHNPYGDGQASKRIVDYLLKIKA